MLRTLEIPLNRSRTAEEAAEMLRRVFEAHFLEKPETAVGAPGRTTP